MRKLLGALAVAGMTVVFSASNADAARCWWNGYTWVCRTPSYVGHWWRHPHWRVARGPWWHHHPHWRVARGPWWHHPHWRVARGPWWHHHWRHWGYGRPYAWYR